MKEEQKISVEYALAALKRVSFHTLFTVNVYQLST